MKRPLMTGAWGDPVNAGTKPYSKLNRPNIHTIDATIHPAAFYHSELPEMFRTNRDGWHDGGRCRFHLDRKVGSFRVNLNTGAAKYVLCGASGDDVVALMMRSDKLALPEALRQLGEDWPVPRIDAVLEPEIRK